MSRQNHHSKIKLPAILLLSIFVLSACGGSSDNAPQLPSSPMPPSNNSPVSNAGEDQTINTVQSVILDGSASSDPDGDNITYSWTIAAQPEQANLSIDSPSSASLTVDIQIEGTYTFILQVSDGVLISDDTVSVFFVSSNQAPTINEFSFDYEGEEGAAEVIFNWMIADSNDTLTCRLDIGNNNVFDYTVDNCDSSSTQAHLFTGDGNYNVRLQVTDSDSSEVEATTIVSVFSSATADLTNLVGPTALGYFNSPDLAENVLVRNNIAYLADTESGVQIIDVSSPKSPQVLAFVDTIFRAQDLAISEDNDVLYVGDPDGLYSIDVSYPNSPLILQSILNDDIAGRRVWLEETTLYVASHQRLVVMDVSDPSQMVMLGEYELGGILAPEDLQVANGRIYLGVNGLQVLDASDPSNITLLGSIFTPVKSFIIDGDFAYVAADDEGLRIINIQNPQSMFEVSVTGSSELLLRDGDANYIVKRNNIAYLGVSGRIQIWNIEDANAPQLLGQTLAQVDTFGMSIQGDLLYVAGDEGLQIFDVSAPVSLVAQDDFIRQANAISQEAIDNQEFIFGRNNIFDVSNPSDTTSINLPSFQVSLAKDNIVYGINNEILTITNYSDPNAGQVESSTQLPTTGVFPNNSVLFSNLTSLQSNILFASYGDGHAHLVDVSDTSNPVAQHINLAQFGYSTILEINASTAFVVAQDFRLALVDISDLTNPIELSRVDINPSRVFIDDSFIYVLELGGFHVFSIEDLAAPELLHSISLFRTNFMQQVDDLLFLGLGQSGTGLIIAIDVSSPEFPTYTFLESGSNATVSVSANQNTLVTQGNSSEATRVYDFSAFLNENE